MRPMRNSADAIVAPVLPADTMAEALPSRTASAARTSDESFILRTLEPGSASMAITSEASMIGRSPVSPISSGSADQDDGHTELVGGAFGAFDDGVGGVVTAHGIDGDGQHVSTSRLRWPAGRRTSRSCHRPGADAWPHRTAGRCCGRCDRRHAEALRLRLFDLDIFRFGTAMVRSALTFGHCVLRTRATDAPARLVQVSERTLSVPTRRRWWTDGGSVVER